MIDHLTYGFFSALRQWRVGLLILCIQVALGLYVGLMLNDVLTSSLGNYGLSDLLDRKFDYTIFNDIINQDTYAFSTVTSAVMITVLAYFFVATFVNAGVLLSLAKAEYRLRSFWRFGYEYFVPFLVYAVMFLLLFVLFSALIWLPILSNGTQLIEYFASDRLYFYLVFFVAFLYLVFISKLFIWSLFTRLHYIHTGQFLSSLVNGSIDLRRSFVSYTGMFFCFFGFGIVLLLLIKYLDTFLHYESLLIVLAVFVSNIALIGIRIMLRFWLYASYLCKYHSTSAL